MSSSSPARRAQRRRSREEHEQTEAPQAGEEVEGEVKKARLSPGTRASK